ncbi:rhomboid protease ROM3, putative [Plasmodium relictum]|uniref:Rhomboid-like protease n=1 Tax=Plasmodium relictum TaxID=85471 RepID=A0A1J1HCP2_PLARL|nr:rhomboid protease ROM3, putative [Plasmodium relictum]CRH03744.1 rhomboid protease ROM3, putative [Plasmodium relictum]
MLRKDTENEENLDFLSENIELIGKNIKNKYYNILFPDISLKKIIVWISFFQVIIYILSCLLSENLETPNVQVLMFLGATYGPSIKHGELWRLLFPIFLHANWWHLIINILCILNLGLIIESKYKRSRFLLIYFLSGIIGNILTTICNPCQLAVGASTSGFGLIGCSILEIFLAWGNLTKKAKNYYIFNISIFLIFFLFVSFSPTVDFFGHIGGFLCGAFLACHYNKFIGYNFFQESLYYSFASICALIIFYLPIRLFVINMPCEVDY